MNRRLTTIAASLAISTCCVSANAADTAADATSSTIDALPEVIVTAQKRPQSIQDTPIAVTAFSGDSLRALGVDSSLGLSNYTPGLQTAPVFGEGNIPNVAIRGVGLNDFRDYNESPSAVYVDEVYKAALASLDFALFDIDRVEVLKGPQGTLFGRNATGGLIQYITNKPTKGSNGYVRTSVGSFGDVNVEAAFGGPIASNVEGRLSVVHHKHSGTENNENPAGRDGDALDLWAVRGQLNFDLGQRATLLLTGEYGQNENNGGNPYRYAPSYLLPNGLAAISPGPNPVVTSSDPSDINVSPGLYLHTHYSSGTAKLDWDFGAVKFVSISNYQSFHKNQEQDCDSAPANFCFTGYTAQTRQFSEEMRLQGTLQAMRWVVGLYYLDFKPEGTQELFGPVANIFFGTPSGFTAFEQHTKSTAGFGQVEYDILPTVTLTGGLRYTTDRKDTYQSFLNGVVPGGIIYDSTTIGSLADSKDSSTSFLVNARWHPTSDLMVYGSVSRAPKSGTVNSGFAPPALDQYVVKPEQLTSYEIGLKSTTLDGRMQINAAAFHYNYKNYQAFEFQNLAQLLFNVDATINGSELEIHLRPVPQLTASLGVAYLDAVAHNVADASGTVRDRAMVLAPRWEANGTLRYDWPIVDGAAIGAQLNVSATSSVYFDNLNQPGLREGSHTTSGAQIDWTSQHQHWQVVGAVRNLTNERHQIFAFDLTSLLGYVQQLYNNPRWYEATVMYRF